MICSVILKRLIVAYEEILIGSRSIGARSERIIPRVSTFTSREQVTPSPTTTTIQLNRTLSRPNWTFLDAAASPTPWTSLCVFFSTHFQDTNYPRVPLQNN